MFVTFFFNDKWELFNLDCTYFTPLLTTTTSSSLFKVIWHFKQTFCMNLTLALTSMWQFVRSDGLYHLPITYTYCFASDMIPSLGSYVFAVWASEFSDTVHLCYINFQKLVMLLKMFIWRKKVLYICNAMFGMRSIWLNPILLQLSEVFLLLKTHLVSLHSLF